MKSPLPVCRIVGAGRAGCALARAMYRAGYRFSCVVSRSADDAERLAQDIQAVSWGTDHHVSNEPAGLLILAVPDSEIAIAALEAAESVSAVPGAVALHLSGSLAADVLVSLHRKGFHSAAFHPAQTFSIDSDPSTVFSGIVFDMEGDDDACAVGERVAVDLGAKALRFPREKRKLLHLSMTIASNYLLSVLRAALDVLEHAGLNEDQSPAFLKPLVMTTINNAFLLGPDTALTGPVSRGDAAVVESHLALAASLGGDIEETCRVLGKIALDMTVGRGGLDKEKAEAVRNILEKR